MIDGVYKINDNKLFNYMVVRRYDDLKKIRYMTTIEDCLQQISEWDDEFASKKKKKATRHYAGYGREYQVYDQNNRKIASGSGKDVANKFGCHINTLINAANRMVNFQKEYHVIAV